MLPLELSQIIIRFFVGGIVVCSFALVGNVVWAKSFAGLFGAAPSVALGTLALTLFQKRPAYAAIECRSICSALVLYSGTALSLAEFSIPAAPRAPRASLLSLPVWFGTSFLLLSVFARTSQKARKALR